VAACPVPHTAVAEPLRKHVDPASPPPLRLMAAKGVVPMQPRDMVTVLTCLCFDDDEKVKTSASESLSGLPERIITGAIQDDEVHAAVLDYLAQVFVDNPFHIERILINKNTPDQTFERLAESVKGNLLDIIANNQVRILRHPPIARSILKNPTVLKSTVDMMMDFAVRTGMDFAGESSFEEAKKRILVAPPDPKEDERIQRVVIASLPEDMLTEEPESASANADEVEARKANMLSRLHKMTAPQKIALAQKGNKVIRLTLVRDANRSVAVAAIKNPGIGESEVAAVVTSRAICDEVLRIICNNREWTKSYQVKLALANNPKTPLAFSMRVMQSLHIGDLKALASNKNIPSALTQAAKKLMQMRSGGH
jgi:hypothetical protein